LTFRQLDGNDMATANEMLDGELKIFDPPSLPKEPINPDLACHTFLSDPRHFFLDFNFFAQLCHSL
jgi:hypothetical protein